MNNSIHRISLDIHDTGSQVSINAKKGDTARSIYITLQENSKPYRIADGCYAVFTGVKPDGNYLFNDCAIKDNVITYDFTEQTVPVVGQVRCEIILYDANNERITSPRFDIIVNDVVYNDEEIVSSDEANALITATAEAKAITAEVEQKLANGEFVGEAGDDYVLTEADKEEIANMAKSPIDQHFNPTSPNAQSGIAVAEALASVPSGGSGEYILLCETTITAEDISEAGENGITRLVVGGEEEQFKSVRELVLDLYMPANDQKNFRFYAGFSTDGTSDIYNAKLIGGHTDGILSIDTTKRTRTKLVTILNGSGKFMYSLLIRSSYGSSVYPNPSVGCVSYLDETAGVGNRNYIYCNGGGFKFPEGTIFKVYGRY